MKRVLLCALPFLICSSVRLVASRSCYPGNSDHQFHFSPVSKAAVNFKNASHHRHPKTAAPAQESIPGQAADQGGLHALSGSEVKSNTKLRRHTSNPPTGKVGFVSATEIPAGGVPYSDGIAGDFNGDGKGDLVAMVANYDSSNSVYTHALSVVQGNGDGTFQNAVLTTIVDACAVLVVGDVNGDNKDDILVVHATGQCGNTASSFDVYLSKGDGSFTQGSNYSISQYAVVGGGLFVTTTSGHLDVFAVVNPGDGTTPSNVVTVLGNGDGTFSATPNSVVLSSELYSAVVGDLNADGLLDIAGLDYNTNQLTVYVAGSASTYSAAGYDTSDGIWDASDVTLGDLTADGKPEIVTTNEAANDNTLSIFVNNADGTFQRGVYYDSVSSGDANSTGSNPAPWAVSIADVNGDGKADLVVTNYNSSDITILLGKGDGTVSVPTTGYATGGGAQTRAVVADFNGDGYPDIVVTDEEFSFAFLQAQGDGTFGAALNYYEPIGDQALGYNNYGMASADLNGDGVLDFVIGGCSTNGGVTVFLSRGDGSLQPGVIYGGSAGLGPCLEFVAVADFNKDGKLDIAATSSGSNNVVILTGKGDGTFTVGAPLTTGGSEPYDLVAADFNSDGYPDLAVINFNAGSGSNIGVLLNDKSGNFQAAVSYPLSNSAWKGIAAGDLGNGQIDLIIPYYGGSSVAMLLGNGDGTFQPETDIAVGANDPQVVTLADLNSDGHVDIIATLGNGSGDDIGILWGAGVVSGVPTFNAAPTFLASSLQNDILDAPSPQSVHVVDVDGDGNQDLVYSNGKYGTAGVLFGAGSGSFYDPVEYPAGRYPLGLAVADVNSDGSNDVVVASRDFAGVTVLLNGNGNGAVLSNYTIAVDSSSATITAGSNATFKFTITPVNHYNGTIRFSCGTLPLLATCTFNPSSVTLDGNTPTTVTLTLTTAAASTPSSAGIRHTAVAPRRISAILLPIGLGMVGLMFVGGFSKRNRGVTIGLIVMAVLFGAACGGSNGSNNTGSNGSKATTTTTLASSNATVMVGASVTFTGRVSASSGAPSGTVTFMDGTSTLGSGTLSSGAATFQTSGLTAGVHSITATYGGDSNFDSSTSTALRQAVQNPGTPAGSYTVTVTATGTAGTNNGNTTGHPVQLNVTVQ